MNIQAKAPSKLEIGDIAWENRRRAAWVRRHRGLGPESLHWGTNFWILLRKERHISVAYGVWNMTFGNQAQNELQPSDVYFPDCCRGRVAEGRKKGVWRLHHPDKHGEYRQGRGDGLVVSSSFGSSPSLLTSGSHCRDENTLIINMNYVQFRLMSGLALAGIESSFASLECLYMRIHTLTDGWFVGYVILYVRSQEPFRTVILLIIWHTLWATWNKPYLREMLLFSQVGPAYRGP